MATQYHTRGRALINYLRSIRFIIIAEVLIYISILIVRNEVVIIGASGRATYGLGDRSIGL